MAATATGMCVSCLNRLLQRPLHRARKPFNFRARHRFGDAHQRMLRKFRIRRTESQWPDDFFPQQVRIHNFHRAWQFDGEFIEERSVKGAPHAGNLQQFRERELRF